jgi:hypothetical protein
MLCHQWEVVQEVISEILTNFANLMDKSESSETLPELWNLNFIQSKTNLEPNSWSLNSVS